MWRQKIEAGSEIGRLYVMNKNAQWNQYELFSKYKSFVFTREPMRDVTIQIRSTELVIMSGWRIPGEGEEEKTILIKVFLCYKQKFQKWLDLERRYWHYEKVKCQDLLQHLSNRLSKLITQEEFSYLKQKVEKRQSFTHSKLHLVKLKKLPVPTYLSERKKWLWLYRLFATCPSGC